MSARSSKRSASSALVGICGHGGDDTRVLVVCLPTYDERENLEPMARAILGVLSEHGLDGRVLVIDDASPDGTGELADRLAAELGFLDVLHRERKEGLGPPTRGVPAGARVGRRPRGHDGLRLLPRPGRPPRLLEAADRAGIGLGSRYVRGGSTRNWGLVRRAVSRGGSVYARAILGIPVRDSTAGFKVYRRDVLEAIGPGRIESKGYAFQIETVYRAIAPASVSRRCRFASPTARGRLEDGPGIVLEAMVGAALLRRCARPSVGALAIVARHG